MENTVCLQVGSTISALRWRHNTLLLGTHDGLSVYATDRHQPHNQHHTITNDQTPKAPILDADFATPHSLNEAVAADADGAITLHNLDRPEASARLLGTHSAAASRVRYCPHINAVVSGSWDATIKIWDARAAEALVQTCAQPDKVYSLCAGAPAGGAAAGSATAEPLLVVATAGRQVNVIDLRAPAEPLQKRESALKSQTRCIMRMPNSRGYVMGSVAGRVAVEYFDPAPEVQKDRYAFKAHRSTAALVDTVHPVNAIAFHPAYGTFVTGGSDGVVNAWDAEHKKRLCQYKGFQSSIAALAFEPESGDRLAIAVSYQYEHGESGEKAAPPDQVLVRTVATHEMRPRQPKGAK